MTPSDMVLHAKDLVKVVGAASTNVVAAAARASVEGVAPVSSGGCAESLHLILTLMQILVAVLTAGYVGLKFWRLWKNKKATM